jgi:hypothetical protein
MYTKEDVARLIADLGALKSKKGDVRDPGDPNVRRQGIQLDVQGREVPVAHDPAGRDVPTRYIGNRDIALEHFAVVGQNPHNIDLSDIEVGQPYMFGLALDIFDPESGEVLRVCRPHRRDTGEAEVFLTPNQIAASVAASRTTRLHNERAGVISPRPLTDEQVKSDEARRNTAKAQQEEAVKVDTHAAQVRQRETGEARAAT